MLLRIDGVFKDLGGEALRDVMETKKLDIEVFKFSGGIVKSQEDDTFTFVYSSGSVDRHGDIVEQNWELENYLDNPVILWNHNRYEPAIGKTDLFLSTSPLTGKIRLLSAGKDPMVDRIRARLEEGILSAVSVGFRPKKWEYRFKDDDPEKDIIGYKFVLNHLLETSIVNIPANPDAKRRTEEAESAPEAEPEPMDEEPVKGYSMFVARQNAGER